MAGRPRPSARSGAYLVQFSDARLVDASPAHPPIIMDGILADVLPAIIKL